jgi:hypothetical protein
LKLALHFGIFSDEDHVSRADFTKVHLLVSPPGGLGLIYAEVVEVLLRSLLLANLHFECLSRLL